MSRGTLAIGLLKKMDRKKCHKIRTQNNLSHFQKAKHLVIFLSQNMKLEIMKVSETGANDKFHLPYFLPLATQSHLYHRKKYIPKYYRPVHSFAIANIKEILILWRAIVLLLYLITPE